MFVLGIIIHLTFLYSIFDIYFKSPIVKNVPPYQPQHNEVADRLVLFVVDGLRAESFVNHTTLKYLRSVANTNGRWGISNTQVPTESRPGHVALIAGFYEDPSAIFKGWKENPVDFDSVFNQSTYTWCWGTYDIVNIFTKGITDNHITVQDFDPYEQSFSTDKDTAQLDAWVFKKVKAFFDNAKNDSNIQEKLQKKKIIFFLHLLGADTAGHTHKPNTLNFLATLSHVDEGIKEIEQVIRDYYGDDGKTTFLMTSDHGMTDWGSHGSGDNHETETPYVIWGSGVEQVKTGLLDPESLDLSLEHRLDVNQVDLAPLMSTILSIPVPVNSIGKPINGLLDMTLPDRAKAMYSVSQQLFAQFHKKRQDVEKNVLPMLYKPYMMTNSINKGIRLTKELLEEGNYLEAITLSKEIFAQSISGLRYYHDYHQRPLLVLVTLSFLGWTAFLLRVLSEQKLNSQAEATTLRGSSSWTIVVPYSIATSIIQVVWLILFFIGTYLVYAQSLPVQYYVYVQMPLLLWYRALIPFDVWVRTLKHLESSGQLSSICFEVIIYIVGCLALVAMIFTSNTVIFPSIPGGRTNSSASACLGGYHCFDCVVCHQGVMSKHYCVHQTGRFDVKLLGLWHCSCFGLALCLLSANNFLVLLPNSGLSFTYKWTLSIPLLGMGLWPFFSSAANQLSKPINNIDVRVYPWLTGSLVLSKFAFTPVVGKNTHIELVLAAGVIWLGVVAGYIYKVLLPSIAKGKNRREIKLTVAQMALLLFAIYNIYVQSDRFETGSPVSYFDQAVAWIVAVLSPVLPMFFSKKMVNRLMAINTSLSTFYLMMSVTHEGFFMLCLAVHVLSWVQLEFNLLNLEKKKLWDCTFGPVKPEHVNEIKVERSICSHDVRRAFFFVLYIILAFFGTGNIASLNSFEVRWVTCFVTSFQPFLITTLILLKTFTPFVVVGCGFVAVQTLTQAPMGCLNIIVLIFSNLMGLQLLYNVQNTGSWLEIGSSISQFVIVEVITVFIVIINKIAKVFTNTSIAGKIYEARQKSV